MLGLGYAAPVSALRCDNALVKEGDYAFEIRQACGPPTAVERAPPPDRQHHHLGVREERWYYDLGSNRLLRVLHLRDGRLRRIETRDHGLADHESAGDCQPTDIQRGMTSYRLLRRCGEPDQRERRPLRRTQRHEGVHRGRDVVWHEEWIYAFGERYIARRVRLVAGEVQSVETVP